MRADVLDDARQACLNQSLQLGRYTPQCLAHGWVREIDDPVVCSVGVAEQHTGARKILRDEKILRDGGIGNRLGGWFGIEARKWMVAARPTAEPQAWGTHSTPWVDASVAIFLHSLMPPAAHTSGCTMSIALRTMASRKPHVEAMP
jgi:hypothetical protein